MLFARAHLLLDPDLSDDAACQMLSAAGLEDWRSARRTLLRLARSPQARAALAALLPYLLERLSTAANPERVLVSLERLVVARGDDAATLGDLAANPRALDILVTLFSSSQYLSEILLRLPGQFERLSEQRAMSQEKSAGDVYAQALAAAGNHSDSLAWMDALRRYQHAELLRIGLCDLLDWFDLATATRQLSNLADGLLQAALKLVCPQGTDGFAVIAMGKLGGRELNYSSDIDLLFIAAPGAEDGHRTGQALIDALARVTAEGFLYRVDMRLRPWGTAGALAPSVESALAYLSEQARLWEKQALLKARRVAGDAALGEDFLRRAAALIFTTPPDIVRAEVSAMKQRTESFLRQRGRGWGEIKLGAGSIRDVEFVAQFLQLNYGARQPEVRSRNTLVALQRLQAFGLLDQRDARILSEGYIFLRTVEHHLQMMDYRQTAALPDDPQALASLARRLGFSGEQAGQAFTLRYNRHSQAIRRVYLKYLEKADMDENTAEPPNQPEVNRHVARMDPSYEAAFSRADIRRHAALAGQLGGDRLVEVDAAQLDGGDWRVTIVAFDYPGELSLICGLMFADGLDIFDGNVFTYEPAEAQDARAAGSRRKIVDVFTVQPPAAGLPEGFWSQFAAELGGLLRLMQAGERGEARARLARRAAEALRRFHGTAAPLYPIGIQIDNDTSPGYTVLTIDAPDTIGFLYELTNALALNRVYISRVAIETAGQRVHDSIYITDANGRKILSPEKQRELRTATVLTKHFTHLLPYSPDPESALIHFNEFIGELFRRPEWTEELSSLERPEVLTGLAQLLGVSDFLWDDFLRMQHANLFPVVSDVDALQTAKSRAQLQAELEAQLKPVHTGGQPPSDEAAWRKVLNEFKDREMFRIDMRHILGHTREFWEFSEELTDLAEVVVNAAYHLSAEDLRSVYGTPRLPNGEISQMAVVALGKCGGRELGFASDIELMFIYSGNGVTDGPERISAGEFHEKAVQNFVSAIRAKREGIFEIDLQLRPYGKAGALAVSLEAFKRYFNPDGAAWPYERQALVKLRPIAGDSALGAQVAALRDQFVYTGTPFDVTAMRAMRERQLRHLVLGGTFNPKFSPGGLVDVEYLVQALQINHGRDLPALRHTNIRLAMAALAEAGILSPDDFTRLRKAHTFLRWLIDGLRVVAGNARDLVVPPVTSEEFAFLARRLRYGDDTAALRRDLSAHTAAVLEINRRLLG